MKIIEALKELRLLEKKIFRNQEYITRYSSMVSTEIPTFNTVEEQREKVKSLLQENFDHAFRKVELKARISYTNHMTYVTIMGRTLTLHNLLDFQRGIVDSIRDNFLSLTDTTGQSRLRNAPVVEGRSPQVVRLYDENYKLTQIDYWDTFKEEINARLEVINAVTDLEELPAVVVAA